MPVSYLTFEINVYIQGYLFGKHAECALNEQKCIVCSFCFFTCPLQWIIFSVKLSRMGKGGNRRSRGSTEENAFGNITLKKLFPWIYCF